MKKPIIGVIPGSNGTVPDGYLKGICDAGGAYKVVRYEGFSGSVEAVADELDGMVFTGGLDVCPESYGAAPWPELGRTLPERDALEIPLFHALFARKKPILGICRGLQIINVAMGGSLIQDIPRVYGTDHNQDKDGPAFTHEVDIAPDSRAAKLFGAATLMTNSYHHQSAERVAAGLAISARAQDGVIEALEYPGDQFLVCLQWHPEKTLGLDEYSMKPFQALLAAVEE